jgi:membrane protein implicated in regulation of membrane protease activity
MRGAFYGVGAAVIAIIARSVIKLTSLTLARDKLLWVIFAANASLTAITESEVLAAFVAFAGLGWEFQAILFAATLMAGLFLIRPRLLRRLEGSAGVPSRTEALRGQAGRVTEAIDPARGIGRVSVGGQDWAARASSPLPAGTEIQVEGADGIVLIVTVSKEGS